MSAGRQDPGVAGDAQPIVWTRQLPSRDAEYAHYLHHGNRPDDPAYHQFLFRLALPLLARLPCRPLSTARGRLRPRMHPDAARARTVDPESLD